MATYTIGAAFALAPPTRYASVNSSSDTVTVTGLPTSYTWTTSNVTNCSVASSGSTSSTSISNITGNYRVDFYYYDGSKGWNFVLMGGVGKPHLIAEQEYLSTTYPTTTITTSAAPESTISLASGDLMIAAFVRTSGGTSPSITGTGGQSWTSMGSTVSNSTFVRVNWYYAVYNGTWSNLTFSDTSAGGQRNLYLGVWRHSGTRDAWGTDVALATNTGSGTNPTVTISSVTRTNSNSFSVGGWFSGHNNITNTWSPATPSTNWWGGAFSTISTNMGSFQNTTGSSYENTMGISWETSGASGSTGSVSRTASATSVTTYWVTGIASFYEYNSSSAPVISSVTHDNAAAANVTATVNLSSSGSGGTALEYAQTTTNSLPSTGWQASANFTHPRGTTRYYWASRDQDNSLYTSSTSLAVGYLNPDVNISVATDSPIAVGATSHNITISSGNANSTYYVRNTSYTGSIITSRVGNGALNVADVPAIGSSKTYYITATRSTSSGGDGSTHSNVTTYSITRNDYDSTPDAFSFNDVTDALTSTLYTSDSITITGIDTSVSVSVSGAGEYEKNGSGTWTTSAGTAVVNDTFKVRHTSAGTSGTTTNTTLTVGGVSDTYTTTTAGGTDSTPDQFDLGDVLSASQSTQYTSNNITLTGMNTTTTWSITGSGEYSRNSGSSWASTPASGSDATNGGTFQLRHTSSSSYSTLTSQTLTVGSPSVSDSFEVTTLAYVPPGTYGLEVYNSSGDTILEVTDRNSKFYSYGTISFLLGYVTSTSSRTIVSSGNLTFTYSFVSGTSPTWSTNYASSPYVKIYNGSNYMYGTVTNVAGGLIYVTITGSSGSGTFSSWTIRNYANISAPGVDSSDNWGLIISDIYGKSIKEGGISGELDTDVVRLYNTSGSDVSSSDDVAYWVTRL